MGYVITFAQQKGGAGKTTLLTNLAASWLAAGRGVAVMDLDPQGSLDRWAERRRDPALVRIVSRDYRASADLRAARGAHDFTLVDCPGSASGLLENAVRASDLVIAPCQPSVLDAWATETIAETASRLATPLWIVLNRMPPRIAALEEVLEALGDSRCRVMQSRLGNRSAFARAFLTGHAAPEISRRSRAAEEVAALRSEIEGVLGNGLRG